MIVDRIAGRKDGNVVKIRSPEARLVGENVLHQTVEYGGLLDTPIGVTRDSYSPSGVGKAVNRIESSRSRVDRIPE